MKYRIYILTLLCLASFISCKDEVEDMPFTSLMIGVDHFSTDKTAYSVGESVNCVLNLRNDTESDLHLSSIDLEVQNYSSIASSVIGRYPISGAITIPTGATHHIEVSSVFQIPANLTAGTACGLLLNCGFVEGMRRTIPASFIRVADDNTLLTYNVEELSYNNLPIFKLRGGMSAEFGVEKTLAMFRSGVSHSWTKGPGGGPEPVLMTPDFLSRSVQKTVALYNDALGAATPINTVIIGTGVPSVSYLSTAMKAPYLPIHFLGSANTVKEVQAVLNYANDNGYPSYATLGYDGSMANVGVAWIKLLDLPAEYKKFLIDHQVQNVIIMGVGEKVIGESYARKVISDKIIPEYGQGSLYIQYTQYGTAGDVAALSKRIYDFKTVRLDANRLIADWESGILDAQIDNFSKSIHASTSAQPYALSCKSDMIALYNVASEIVPTFVKKNESKLTSPYINGVTMNEYLIAQPQYDMLRGYVPFLYWQFAPVSGTVNRTMTIVKSAVARQYPSIVFTGLKFRLNSGYKKEDIKTNLISQNVPAGNISMRGDQIMWDPADGMLAPSELAAVDIVTNIGVDNFKNKFNACESLTIDDVTTMSRNVSGLTFEKK